MSSLNLILPPPFRYTEKEEGRKDRELETYLSRFSHAIEEDVGSKLRDISSGADNTTDGNFPSFDEDGLLEDSGYSPSSFISSELENDFIKLSDVGVDSTVKITINEIIREIYQVTKLVVGAGEKCISLDGEDATYRVAVGGENYATCPFSIDKDGNVKATSGEIGGWLLRSTGLISGTGAETVGVDSGPYPFWAGAEEPTDSPFYVTKSGIVNCSALRLTGLVEGSDVDGTYLRIGTVSADKLTVDELSSISASLGSVISGYILAAIMKTSESGSRVVISDEGLAGYDSVIGLTFKLPTDGTPPLFSSGTIQSATIIDTTIVSNDFKTSNLLPYLAITDDGFAYHETQDIGLYNEFQYGDGTKYGVGVSAYYANPVRPILSVEAERTYADVRLYNRDAEPSGEASIGDLACVDGTLRMCTTAGTPGIYKTLAFTE